MATDFAKEIKEMRREILELKTSQQLAPHIRSYVKSFTISAQPSDYPNGHLRITYDAGDGDILTEILTDLSVWAGTPANDEQDFYVLAYTASAFQNAPIFVMSTRPILKVELID